MYEESLVLGKALQGTSAVSRGRKIAIEASRCGFMCGNKSIGRGALWHCRDGRSGILLYVFPLELVSGRSFWEYT